MFNIKHVLMALLAVCAAMDLGKIEADVQNDLAPSRRDADSSDSKSESSDSSDSSESDSSDSDDSDSSDSSSSSSSSSEISSSDTEGWRNKYKRTCHPCPDEMRTAWRDPRILWICGAYQRARRSFKSECMMHYRNCQDGTMFTKIHDHRCKNDSYHGEHFFYDYKT